MQTGTELAFGWACNENTSDVSKKHTKAGQFIVMITSTDTKSSVVLSGFKSGKDFPAGPIPYTPEHMLTDFEDRSILDELEWNYFGSGGWTLDHQSSNGELLQWLETVKTTRGAIFF